MKNMFENLVIILFCAFVSILLILLIAVASSLTIQVVKECIKRF